MREQTTRALGKLATDVDRDTAIHETRKSMKRLRALLRLIRPALDKQTYQRENLRCRDINRLLSSARDEHVILETIANLRDPKDEYSQTAFDRLVEAIQVDNNTEKKQHTKKTLQKAMRLLTQARTAIKDVKIDDSGFETVRHGFVRSYEKAKTHMAKIQAKPKVSDDAIHEWRKSVQTHWRQMALLTECWPDFIAHRIVLAKALSQDLGEDHDLSILSAFISKQIKKAITASQANSLLKLISARRNRLRQAAMAKGALLFADSAEDLGLRIKCYWKVHVANEDLVATPASSVDVPPSPTRERTTSKVPA